MLILVLRENTRFMICRSARRREGYFRLWRTHTHFLEPFSRLTDLFRRLLQMHFIFFNGAIFWLLLAFDFPVCCFHWSFFSNCLLTWSLVLTFLTIFAFPTCFSISVYYYCWTFFCCCISSESRTLAFVLYSLILQNCFLLFVWLFLLCVCLLFSFMKSLDHFEEKIFFLLFAFFL